MVYYLKTITKYSKLTKLGMGNLKGETEEFWIENPPLILINNLYDIECEGDWKGTPKIKTIKAHEVEDEQAIILKKCHGPKKVPTLREIATLASEYVSSTPDQTNKYQPRILTVEQVIEALKFYLSDDYEGEHRAAKFVKCPASLKYHDSQDGGLLRHVVKMLEMCSKIIVEGKFYEYEIHPLRLVTGIIFHDMGKVDQYVQNDEGFWEQSPDASYLGNHIGLGIIRWSQKGKEVCRILGDETMFVDVMHMIMSHHGPVSNGFGSLVDPFGHDAWTLYSLDMMDSRQEETYKPVVEE